MTEKEAIAVSKLLSEPMVWCPQCQTSVNVTLDRPVPCPCCDGDLHVILPQNAHHPLLDKVYDLSEGQGDEPIYVKGQTPEGPAYTHYVSLTAPCGCATCRKVRKAMDKEVEDRLPAGVPATPDTKLDIYVQLFHDLCLDGTRKFPHVRKVLAKIEPVSWANLYHCYTSINPDRAINNENTIAYARELFGKPHMTVDDWPRCMRCYHPLCLALCEQWGHSIAFCHTCDEHSYIEHRLLTGVDGGDTQE